MCKHPILTHSNICFCCKKVQSLEFLELPQCWSLTHGLSANWLLPVASLHFHRWPFHLHIEFIQTQVRAKTTPVSSPSFRTWLLCFVIRPQLPGLAEQTVMVRAMSSKHLMLAAQASLPESSLAHIQGAYCTTHRGHFWGWQSVKVPRNG